LDKSLYYKKSGNGPLSIILFHGFGQDHQAFNSYIDLFGNAYTVYSFDLYYHGNSIRMNKPLSKEEWRSDIQQFLKNEQIDQFDLIAFSLGGRFALAMAMDFPSSIKKLILLAPDGVYQNFWYQFSTSTYGNWLFRYLMLHPTRFGKWLSVFAKFKLASSSLIRFAQKELKDRENCLRVYQTWSYFKPLQVNLSKLIKHFNKHKVSVHLFLGDQDYIIPPNQVMPKLDKLKYLNPSVLPLKHHHLIEGTKWKISSLLNEEKL
jgi:pimeloyl-ACP methyl ester carboxylesterase